MKALPAAAAEFLSQRRIAVAGVSRQGTAAANGIYRRLRGAGYEVFAVNPQTDEVEGDRCYRSLRDIPEPPDGVVIATHPTVAARVVEECAQLGIRRVWLHRSFGTGSVDPAAVALCQREGIAVLDGGCPMMFLAPVDVGHRCMRWVLNLTGKLPDAEAYRT